MQLSCKLFTIDTIVFDNQVYTFYPHLLRQLEFRYSNVIQTKCFFAIETVKMGVQIIQAAITIVVTYGIFYRTRTVIKAMYK